MADSRDMVIVHRVFRREFGLLPQLVRGTTPDDDERRALLCAHGRLVIDVLHHHHEGEDLLLWPKLRERAPAAAELVDRMDGDHAALDLLLSQVEAALAAWRTSGSTADGERLAAAAEALTEPMTAHLDAEEVEVLPHVDALLTDEEWGELGARAFSLLAEADALNVLGAMAEDCPDAEWAWFETHLPPPVVEAHRGHAAAYRGYVEAVRRPA